MKRLWAWFITPIQYIKRSFYRKMLLAFFTIIIITVASLGANFYFETSDSIKQSAISNMERTTEQAVQTLQLQMGSIMNDTWSFFSDEELQRLVKNFSENSDKLSYFDYKFSIMRNNNPLIEIILVNDNVGLERIQKITNKKYYGDSGLFESEKRKLSQIAISNDGMAKWVLVQIYDIQSKKTFHTIAYTQALKDVYGELQPIIGDMVMFLSFDKLQTWLSSLKIQDRGEFYLVNKLDNSIILSTEPSSIGKPLFQEANLLEWNKYPDEPYTFVKDQNLKSLVVYRSLENTDWILVGKIPVHVLLEQVNAVARKTILIGLVCLLAAMLLAGLLSSRVLVPIRRLRKGMRQIEQGNYKIEVPVETNDEIGFFVAGFNKMTLEIDRLIRKVYEAELKKKDAEIKALQSQINPHFLYNTLGSIESLAAVQGDNKRIRDICHSLAQMMRYNVNGGSFSTLGEEIQQIKQYLMIQQIRYESRLAYDIRVEPELETMRIPKLLFQPIVENSIIHGIEGLRRGGKIRIEAVSLNEQAVVISVKDNGIGMSEDKLTSLQSNLHEVSLFDFSMERQQNSIGIVNAHSRLKLIYGDAYGLTIESQLGKGTDVCIRLMKTVI